MPYFNKFTSFISLFTAILFVSFPSQTQAITNLNSVSNLPDVVFTASRSRRVVAEPPFDISGHLKAPDGSTSTISIPDIGVSAPLIYAKAFDSQSSDWNCLKSYRQCPMRFLLRYGILHIFGTPLPGEIGNSIIVGHSSCFANIEKVNNRTSEYCKVLARMPGLSTGTKITISYSNGRQQTFEVFDSYRVYMANAKKITTQMDAQMKRINAKQAQINRTKNARLKSTYEKQLATLQAQYDNLVARNKDTNVDKRNNKFPNERVLTVETCFPLGTSTDRWVVQAKLIEDKYPTETNQQ